MSIGASEAPVGEHFADVSLKNNTPVNTEVLWGGGLWWGLRAGAPHGDDNQKVFDIDHAIFVFITCTRPLDTTCTVRHRLASPCTEWT